MPGLNKSTEPISPAEIAAIRTLGKRIEEGKANLPGSNTEALKSDVREMISLTLESIERSTSVKLVRSHVNLLLSIARYDMQTARQLPDLDPVNSSQVREGTLKALGIPARHQATAGKPPATTPPLAAKTIAVQSVAPQYKSAPTPPTAKPAANTAGGGFTAMMEVVKGPLPLLDATVAVALENLRNLLGGDEKQAA